MPARSSTLPGRHRGRPAQGGELLCGGSVLERPRAISSSPRWSAPGRHADRAHRNLRADPVPDAATTTSTRPSRCKTTCRRACRRRCSRDRLQVGRAFLTARGSDCGIANVNIGTSRRGDRRRLRRREGYRRRPRGRLRLLEGLHAAPDRHHQLELAAAAGARHPNSTCEPGLDRGARARAGVPRTRDRGRSSCA